MQEYYRLQSFKFHQNSYFGKELIKAQILNDTNKISKQSEAENIACDQYRYHDNEVLIK